MKEAIKITLTINKIKKKLAMIINMMKLSIKVNTILTINLCIGKKIMIIINIKNFI
jgi:hypothetical protein